MITEMLIKASRNKSRLPGYVRELRASTVQERFASEERRPACYCGAYTWAHGAGFGRCSEERAL